MKKLLLLRHAKSDRDDPRLGDFGRPLSQAGQMAAQAMARYMAAHAIHWDICLCSPAQRTKESWEKIRTEPQSARFYAELYLASASQLLHIIKNVTDDANTILVIGHNPGLYDLCLQLSHMGAQLNRVTSKFSTGALAVLECDVESWAALKPGCAVLKNYIHPRDLLKNTA